MVMYRHINCTNFAKRIFVRFVKRVCRQVRLFSVCLVLSACDAGSTTSTQGLTDDPPSSSSASAGTSDAAGTSSTAGDSVGTTTDTGTAGDSGNSGSVTVGGSTTTGTTDPGPTTPQPMAIRLQTAEEVSIDGSFELFGEASGTVFAEQRFSVITQPRNGTVIHSGGSRQFTYAPEQDFFGEDDFVYAIGPGLAARVTVEVVNVNDPPVIR